MLDCVDGNVGKYCDVCDITHREMEALPERTLTFTELQELASGRTIDGIIPIVRIEQDREDKGYFEKTVPQIVTIIGNRVTTLWNNPQTECGWVVVEEKEELEEPFLYARGLSCYYRMASQEEQEIKGCRVIQNDDTLPDIEIDDFKEGYEMEGMSG